MKVRFLSMQLTVREHPSASTRSWSVTNLCPSMEFRSKTGSYDHQSFHVWEPAQHATSRSRTDCKPTPKPNSACTRNRRHSDCGCSAQQRSGADFHNAMAQDGHSDHVRRTGRLAPHETRSGYASDDS